MLKLAYTSKYDLRLGFAFIFYHLKKSLVYIQSPILELLNLTMMLSS